jgi:glucan biosynthesis protein C
MLLIFDFGYAVWRLVPAGKHAGTDAKSPFPGWIAVGGFIVVLGLVSFLLRIVIPMGKEIKLIAYFLNFPTIAYLPQYLGLFVIGLIAYRRGWLTALPASAGTAGFILAAMASVILFPLAISGNILSLKFQDPAQFVGLGTWQSAAYALWDSSMAIGMSLGLIVLFRRFFDAGGSISRFLSRHSYGVYILHCAILVHVAYQLRNLDLTAFSKFALAATIVIPLSFAAAWLLRKLPLVSRVL